MIALFRASNALDRTRIILFLAFLFVCAAFGGASRGDVPSHIPVRLMAIAVLAASLVRLRRADIKADRFALLFLLAIALLMAIQLIPLPPGLWEMLPGRSPYADVARATGTADMWRPLSLTPDLTLDSLLSVLPPLAAIFGLCSLPSSFRYSLLPLLIAIVLVNALVGVVQVAQGEHGSLYAYRVTNIGYPVGFFSNRNHQALFMAMAVPMLALWAVSPLPNTRQRLPRFWFAVATGAALVPLILIAGSRAGLVLAIFGSLGGFALVRFGSGKLPWSKEAGHHKLLKYLIIAPALLLAGVTLFMARAESVRRLFDVDVTLDPRYTYLAEVVQMARDFFPLGSGFGSFEPVFRMYEPETDLTPLYFNHAHNDLLEILIEGGLASLLLLLVFLVWLSIRSAKAWKRQPRRALGTDYARLGSLVVVMALAASVADYPMRTPMIGVVVVIALSWMALAGRQPDFLRSSQMETPFSSTSATRHRSN